MNEQIAGYATANSIAEQCLLEANGNLDGALAIVGQYVVGEANRKIVSDAVIKFFTEMDSFPVTKTDGDGERSSPKMSFAAAGDYEVRVAGGWACPCGRHLRATDIEVVSRQQIRMLCGGCHIVLLRLEVPEQVA